MVANQSESTIATPEMWAFKAQVLAMITPFLDSQNQFKFDNKKDLEKNKTVSEQEAKNLSEF